MKLSELLKLAGIDEVQGDYSNIGIEEIQGDNSNTGTEEMRKDNSNTGTEEIQWGFDPEITGIYSDSRQVTAGSIFVAVKGVTVDGHDFIEEAIERGAAVVFGQTHAPTIGQTHRSAPTIGQTHAPTIGQTHAPMIGQTHRSAPTNFITVYDSADALGRLASAWYGEPSKRMKVVGVTGTNGKTTIATLLYHLFRRLGYKAGLLSTVCNYVDDEAVPTEHTTPDPLTINRLMARMVAVGCEYAFMEVSSHAIDQQRISGIDFDGGIFTNLTRDHLDYHQTTENYLKAKKRFFDELPDSAFALTNMDDKNGMVMLQNTDARRLTYSLQTIADFKGKIIESHIEGTEMEINRQNVFTHFTGRFNAYNLLAVYGAAVALGEDKEEVIVALSTLHPVSGRFETIHSRQGVTAIVDYAHTPDALENVLRSIHEVLDGKGQVITVVGAGGNRDKGKRPLMAQAAVRMSDRLILTSDNPRFENPDDIIRDMYAGLNTSEKDRTLCIADRREAIKVALAFAKKGDITLVAGKGHENYQDIGGKKYPFDDKEIISEIFNRKD